MAAQAHHPLIAAYLVNPPSPPVLAPLVAMVNECANTEGPQFTAHLCDQIATGFFAFLDHPSASSRANLRGATIADLETFAVWLCVRRHQLERGVQ